MTRRTAARVLARQALNIGSRDAGQAGDMVRRIGLDMLPQLLKSNRMLGDIIAVVKTFFDNDAHKAKRQSRVRARLDGDMPVGDLGSAGSVWIDHHESCAIAACFLDEGPQVNVIAMDIRGPGNDVPGMAEVFRVGAQLLPIDRHQGIAAGGCADGAIEP